MQWFYTRSRQQMGPISEHDLRELVRAGEVETEDYGWREGWEDWIKIRQLFPQELAWSSRWGAKIEADNPYALPQTKVVPAVGPKKKPPPNVQVKRVSVGLWLGLWGSFWLQFFYFLWDRSGGGGNDVAVFLLLSTFVIATIYNGVILYRMWWIIRSRGFNPSSSVVLAMIPIVNLLWNFVVYWKWSREYNRFRLIHQFRDAPEMPTFGFFLYALSRLAVLPLLVWIAPGNISPLVFALIPIMGFWKTIHAARAVNYFHQIGQPGTSRWKHKPGK